MNPEGNGSGRSSQRKDDQRRAGLADGGLPAIVLAALSFRVF
jgi:hypothetical protein